MGDGQTPASRPAEQVAAVSKGRGWWIPVKLNQVGFFAQKFAREVLVRCPRCQAARPGERDAAEGWRRNGAAPEGAGGASVLETSSRARLGFRDCATTVRSTCQCIQIEKRKTGAIHSQRGVSFTRIEPQCKGATPRTLLASVGSTLLFARTGHDGGPHVTLDPHCSRGTWFV